jgi:signal transduction histidine kinase
MDFTQAAIFQFETPAAPRCISQAGAAMVLPAALLESDGLAQIMQNRQPLIIPAWQPVQPGPACCWLGVPLAVQERTLGAIIFLHRQPDYYQPAQASLALAFAQQLAAALENARLYEQAGQLAVLQERQRLARELHDSVSQVLYSIGLGAKSARTALDRHSDQAGEAIDYVNRLAEAGQVEMRALIFELRPESLRTDGLIAALDRQIAVLRARHQLKVIAQLGAEPAVPLEIKEAVYRIFQEACYNIVRHARASQVRITLRAASPGLILEIEDDGVGFDPVVDYPGHLGLRSMHERAAGCGGRLEITSRAGQGTRILLTMPISGPAEPIPAKTPIKD